MSDVNNLDLKCPFNPDQYNIGDDNITVPAGTSAWALSLVYLGKQVHRSGWNAPIEHMRLAYKSEEGSANDGTAYIEKSDKDGYWSRWQPTQEDLLACDWMSLKSELKPDNSVLEFDLSVGSGIFDNYDKEWGYLANSAFESIGRMNAFGSLAITYNKTNITKISLFIWDSSEGGQILINASSSNNQDGYQMMKTLFNKDLTLTVNDAPYHLGSAAETTNLDGRGTYEYGCSYTNTDAQKLGTLLQQNVGNTLHFRFNWK
ncbi:Thoeris anti-defense Tad2 family protein [Xenorhabdus bovienii]|uniref:Uncharacterized protein n=1 Tax=Xenorhabdus bovienii str. kraussei Becker Underwood TaxID=1398204 RepID=A0A077PWA0_XENBV|nr:MW1434 family type I TA system toxin [Xenorhabdus bovienii]CDH24976.1 conserved hypothetical protein [Xenorhabdus bovienii str. kraussei Becker Underwood]